VEYGWNRDTTVTRIGLHERNCMMDVGLREGRGEGRSLSYALTGMNGWVLPQD